MRNMPRRAIQPNMSITYSDKEEQAAKVAYLRYCIWAGFDRTWEELREVERCGWLSALRGT